MKSNLPKACPSCGEELKVKALHCPSCSTTIEGQFDLPLLTLLNKDDQDFIVSFVRHSGSLKKMSKELNLSYPTVRNKLNNLINAINTLEQEKHQEL